MLPHKTRLILGLLGTMLLSVFIVGVAHSISTGFAGFWGGLPFWVIAVVVLSMAWFDFFDQCVRKTSEDKKAAE
jgi:membrane protein implicated in regulation of membrane protease activity